MGAIYAEPVITCEQPAGWLPPHPDPRSRHRGRAAGPRADLSGALVRTLRTAVDRVTRALACLDDSSGRISEDLCVLMALYTRACHTSPPFARRWQPGWSSGSGTGRAGRRSASRTSHPPSAPRAWPPTWPPNTPPPAPTAGETSGPPSTCAKNSQPRAATSPHIAVLAEDLEHPDRYRSIGSPGG